MGCLDLCVMGYLLGMGFGSLGSFGSLVWGCWIWGDCNLVRGLVRRAGTVGVGESLGVLRMGRSLAGLGPCLCLWDWVVWAGRVLE
jgi:hypothetical protein